MASDVRYCIHQIDHYESASCIHYWPRKHGTHAEISDSLLSPVKTQNGKFWSTTSKQAPEMLDFY